MASDDESADRKPLQPESSVSPDPISVNIVGGDASKFMTAEELFEILSAADSTMAVKEVPKRYKMQRMVSRCILYLVSRGQLP